MMMVDLFWISWRIWVKWCRWLIYLRDLNGDRFICAVLSIVGGIALSGL